MAIFISLAGPAARGVIDLIGHGTNCAAIILALAPKVIVTPLRVFNARLETSPEVLCAAMTWATLNRFDVLSLSLSTDREDVRDELYWLCEKLRTQGTIVVAAARNADGGGYPAVFDNVIGVRSEEGVGASITANLVDEQIEIVVRGWIGQQRLKGSPCGRSSTSYASAMVVGVVARILATERRPSVDDLRNRLPRLWRQFTATVDELNAV